MFYRYEPPFCLHEPSPRWGHFSAPIEGQCPCIYGGHTTEEKKDELERELHKWDSNSESWIKLNTSGSYPEGLFDGASTSTSTALYTYGGADGAGQKGSLYKLDISTLRWTQLASGTGSGPDSPMAKIGCQMVIYEDTLVLFGGYGAPLGPIQPGAVHVKNTGFPDDRGWTNELHCFDLKRGEGLIGLSSDTISQEYRIP